MIILALLVGGLLLGLHLLRTSYVFSGGEVAGFGLTLLSAAALFVALVYLPSNRMEVSADIEQYRAVQETVERARAAGRDIENAALQLRIAEMNQWRASALYWRRSAFGLWWPAEVETLEPIR